MKKVRIEKSALVQADCLTLLERLPKDQVTLAYLDPPWGTQFSSFELDQTDSQSIYSDSVVRVLLQIHRVLSESGTLYYHHSPYSSLYARLVLDQIFGPDGFLTEIVLPGWHVAPYARGPHTTHSTLLVYSKTDSYIYNQQYRPLSPDVISKYSHCDEVGSFMLRTLTTGTSVKSRRFRWRDYELPPGHCWRYSKETLEQLDQQGRIHHSATTSVLPRLKVYLDDSPGAPIGGIWNDIPPTPTTSEILEGEKRFFSQQPLVLLDRVIRMSSNSGDVVLDPFCGSGTTLVSAQNNGRRWIGCDTLEYACDLATRRLLLHADAEPGHDFRIINEQFLKERFEVASRPYRELVTGPRQNTVFVLNQPASFEENRVTEFKEVKGQKPRDAIKNEIEQYAVAYLNAGRGGSILWGFRNSDGTVAGVELDHQQRDDLRQVIINKLMGIDPPLTPDAYSIRFEPVYERGVPIQDVYVVDVGIPPPLQAGLYRTASGKVYVKTEAGVKKLTPQELVDWERRHAETGEEVGIEQYRCVRHVRISEEGRE